MKRIVLIKTTVAATKSKKKKREKYTELKVTSMHIKQRIKRAQIYIHMPKSIQSRMGTYGASVTIPKHLLFFFIFFLLQSGVTLCMLQISNLEGGWGGGLARAEGGGGLV